MLFCKCFLKKVNFGSQCVREMPGIKFSINEVDEFGDRIKNVLENDKCRNVFKEYLYQNHANKIRIVDLWLKADQMASYDSSLLDSIEKEDHFTRDILAGNAGDKEKLAFIKNVCERKVEDIRNEFIKYLQDHFM